jgi:peptidoglycan hydrolase CwlO-like protein
MTGVGWTVIGFIVAIVLAEWGYFANRIDSLVKEQKKEMRDVATTLATIDERTKNMGKQLDEMGADLKTLQEQVAELKTNFRVDPG